MSSPGMTCHDFAAGEEDLSVRTQKNEVSPPSPIFLMETLPLSDDLLSYYKNRTERAEREYRDALAYLDQIKVSHEDHHRLTWELHQRVKEITDLQRALSEANTQVFEERQQLLNLVGENDELKVQELKDRRKIRYLLTQMHHPEEETTYFKDKLEQRYVKSTKTEREPVTVLLGEGVGSTTIGKKRKPSKANPVPYSSTRPSDTSIPFSGQPMNFSSQRVRESGGNRETAPAIWERSEPRVRERGGNWETAPMIWERSEPSAPASSKIRRPQTSDRGIHDAGISTGVNSGTRLAPSLREYQRTTGRDLVTNKRDQGTATTTWGDMTWVETQLELQRDRNNSSGQLPKNPALSQGNVSESVSHSPFGAPEVGGSAQQNRLPKERHPLSAGNKEKSGGIGLESTLVSERGRRGEMNEDFELPNPQDEMDHLNLTIKSLRAQLEEQRKLHQETVAGLLQDRQARIEEESARVAHDEARIEELVDRVGKLQGFCRENTRELMETRQAMQTSERKLREEKALLAEQVTELSNKLAVEKGRNDSVESTVEARITKKSESLIAELRHQVGRYDEEGRDNKRKFEQAEIAYKKKIEFLQSKLDNLGASYKLLKRRRDFEIEGFTNDILMLRKQLKVLEKHILKFGPVEDKEMQLLSIARETGKRAEKISSDLHDLKGKMYRTEREVQNLAF